MEIKVFRTSNPTCYDVFVHGMVVPRVRGLVPYHTMAQLVIWVSCGRLWYGTRFLASRAGVVKTEDSWGKCNIGIITL